MSQLPNDFNQSWLGRLLAPLTLVILPRDVERSRCRDGATEDYEAARRRHEARQRQAR
jgi:hypothetical protein